MKWLLCAVFSLFSLLSFSSDTLHIYINSGVHTLIDGSIVNCKSLDSDTSFNFDGNIFKIKPGVQTIHIHNSDSIEHEMSIDLLNFNESIPATQDLYKSINLVEGQFRISSTSLIQRYLGLQGMLIVQGSSKNKFYWDIKDIQTGNNSAFELGEQVDLENYTPNYFMINGRGNPEINNDSLAKITGQVGDTIYLTILNSGFAVHSLHFHGYHFTVMESSKSARFVGWEKDTYAVYPNELVVFRIIPDKPGEYPIHDHNLVATTANNIYPSGMFTTMIIAP